MTKLSSSNTLKATHEGELQIGNRHLSVAVLKDGRRIINQTAVFAAFGRPMRGSRAKTDQNDHESGKLPGLIDAQNLKPFITNELAEVIKPVKYRGINGKVTAGYDAIILPLICEVYLEARNAKKEDGKPVLSQKQMPNAIAAELVMRSLSKVGIIALVDEATGYQYDRERDELQKILHLYISEELLPWQKKFPDIFYQEIFRLRGWAFTVSNIKAKPSVIGTWTNKIIYEQLPKGVLEELKSKTPKSAAGNYTARLHQSLTEDIGNPHLQAQINSVIPLMQISDTWMEFIHNFNKMIARRRGQMEIKFDGLP